MSSQRTEIARREFLIRSGLATIGTMAMASNVPASASVTESPNVSKDKNKLRVAACQILCYPDVIKSAQKVIDWLKIAAKDGVDVVSFPEACLCGYPSDINYWKTADPEAFKKGENMVILAAKELDIAVVFGTVHWQGTRLFNDLLMIDKGGKVLGRYSKIHLAESWPVSGDILPIYTLAGVKSCFIICHDVRYPELVRLPAIAGAQICYFCSHESSLVREDKLSAYRAMPISRAAENSVFLVMANSPYNPKTMEGSHGNSKIINPMGNVIDEAGYLEERLVTATIDISEATRAMALRAVNDETLLKQWMIDGVKLVRVFE